ncbi:hypothetical protein [Nostoc sp.]|uniref:hypothetical protein n=1 Tax=Nostoc sp. TaxID=1180 RepID=UPI002FF7D539
MRRFSGDLNSSKHRKQERWVTDSPFLTEVAIVADNTLAKCDRICYQYGQRVSKSA